MAFNLPQKKIVLKNVNFVSKPSTNLTFKPKAEPEVIPLAQRKPIADWKIPKKASELVKELNFNEDQVMIKFYEEKIFETYLDKTKKSIQFNLTSIKRVNNQELETNYRYVLVLFFCIIVYSFLICLKKKLKNKDKRDRKNRLQNKNGQILFVFGRERRRGQLDNQEWLRVQGLRIAGEKSFR